MEVVMSRSHPQFLSRDGIAVVLALFASGALAEEKMTTDPVKIDCLARAQLHYKIDDATCFAYPAVSQDFARCRSDAIEQWGRAIAACQTSAGGIRPIGKLKVAPGATAPATEIARH